MTKQQILELEGVDINNPAAIAKFYEKFPTQEAFEQQYGGLSPTYKQGGWIQKATASIKRRGTEGVCTGSNFGGPSCRPGTRRYALAKTFRKMAKARKKEEGGYVDYDEMPYAEGGTVDALQLMGMPTPSMYGMGGTTNIGDLSHVISRKNFPNMGMGYGGQVPMLKSGGFWNTMEDVGKLTVNTLAAPLEQVSGNNFVNWNYNSPDFANAAAVSEGVIGGATDVAGSVFLGPAYGMGKGQVQGFTSKMGNSKEYQRGAKDWANKTGQIASSAGDLTAGIVSGNPQQIVGGAGKLMGTAGGELGSKELQGFGQLAGMASSFVPGAPQSPGQGFKSPGIGMNTTGGQNYNMFGMPDTMFYGKMGGRIPYAMGGQVNYPQGLRKNMGNMPTFAMGGMTGPMTEINVEKDELLTDKDGRIVTEYKGGGMVPHPKDGTIDDRGTVPAQEGMFVITKAMAPKYKKAMEESDFTYAQAIRNNIAFDKARKEAKEEAAATTAMNKMVAKYGGAIERMYAKGGMIEKYQGGTTVQQPVTMSPYLYNMAQYYANPNNFYLTGPATPATPTTIGNNAVANIMQNTQTNPFLNQVLQSQQAPAPAARPYNSNVKMSPGLSATVANFMNPNNFYLTGPPTTATPGTIGTPSVQSMIQGMQPSPFLQRVTQGVQPSPFLQRSATQGRTATPSSVITAGQYQAPRPAYTGPGTPVRKAAAPAATTPYVSFADEQPVDLRADAGYYDFPDYDASIGPVQNSYTDVSTNQGLSPWGLKALNRMGNAAPAGQAPAANQAARMAGNSTGGGSTYTPNYAGLQDTETGTPRPSWFNRNSDTLLQAAQFLPGIYNIGRGLFEKAWEPGNYETPADIKWRELTGEAGRRDLGRAYAGMKRGVRGLGNSPAALAALTQGANNYYGQLAKYNENLENINRQGQSETDRFNKAIQQANMQMRMNRDYLAQQAREAKAGLAGTGLEQLGGAAGTMWQNKQMMDALRMGYGNAGGNPYANPYGNMYGSPSNSQFKDFSNAQLNLDYSRPKFR